MSRSRQGFIRGYLVSVLVWVFSLTPWTDALAQLQFTEVFGNTSANPESPWEWVEIRNVSGGPLDLDGYVFDDDQFNPLTAANITSDLGNTLIANEGVAVLYNAEDITAAQFRDAWGNSVPLIGVTNFPGLLASGERLGLWQSLASYGERDFGASVLDVNFSAINGFPSPSNGKSIAWNGTGGLTGFTQPTRWVESSVGTLNAIMSTATENTEQINNTNDTANPGRVPNSPSATGIHITEIMFNPASTTESDFEFIEIFNNTGATIDFANDNYVLDDRDSNDLAAANITSGSITQGEAAVLFNSDLSVDLMEQAWGDEANFIPVDSWSSLRNGIPFDTIALWDDFSDYSNEPTTGDGRTTENAVTALMYQNGTNDWPNDDGNGSIYLGDLTADPTDGSNWVLSGTEEEDAPFQSSMALPMILTEQLNPGTDIGSPGIVANFANPTTSGDFNSNGVVDAADYAVWLANLGASDESGINFSGDGGGVGISDYELWRASLGNGVGSGAGGQIPEPVGLALAMMGLAAIAATDLRLHRIA